MTYNEINNIGLDKRKRNLTLPPCYIDANIIINSTLESDPKWQSNHPKEYSKQKVDIDSSYKLFYNWNPGKLYTSRYAIAEFFAAGQSNRFGKTFEELNEILNEEILQNCTLLPAKFSDSKIPDEKMSQTDKKALSIKYEYDKNHEESLVIWKNGNVNRSRSLSENIFDYERKNLKKIHYEFPFLEYMLFIEITKLGIEKSIGLKDILHLIYAKNPPIVFLVTHDKDFREVINSLNSKGYYSVEGIKAKELIDRYLKNE